MYANPTYFHMCCFSSASITNGVTNFDLPARNDQVFTVNTAGHFILPQPGKLRAAAVFSATMSRARLNTPVLRYVGLPYLAPINASITIPSPVNVFNPGEYGPNIPQSDEVTMEVTISGGAPEAGFAFALFSFGRQEPPSGQEYRLRFTSTITGSTTAWVSGAITPDAVLPAGKYAVIGMDLFGTNLLAGRLIFPGSFWRPGSLARNTVGQVPAPLFTNGELGTFGIFDSVNLPNLEIACSGANTAQEMYLDVVRLGDR